MEMPESDRFLTCGGLYEAEKALIESLAPDGYSQEDLRQFVFYHMHGVEMPEGAKLFPNQKLTR